MHRAIPFDPDRHPLLFGPPHAARPLLTPRLGLPPRAAAPRSMATLHVVHTGLPGAIGTPAHRAPHRHRKPEPGIYLLACARNGVAPSEAVFLDDLGM